jgi:hypothetical protein
MRPGAVIALSLLVLACGGALSPGSSHAPNVGSPLPANQDLLAQLTAAGLPIDDATFLAATTVEASETAKRTAHVVEHLASGDTIEFTVHVEPDAAGDPSSVSATSTTTDTEISVHLAFVVEADGLPSDVRDALTAGARPAVADLDGSLLLADASLFDVTVDWILKKVESTIRDNAIKSVLQSVVPKQVGTIMKIIKAGFTVEKGVKVFDELDTLLEALDKLAECAENPTNPLTQKQYQEDPGAKDRVLEQIAEARREIIANSIVIQLGVLNGFAAGFGPKWLGYVIGPGTAWSKATLDQINKDRLAEIQRGVPRCDCATGGNSSGGSSGGGAGGGSSGGGTSGGGSGGTCEVPLTWAGNVDYSIQRDDQIIFTAHITNVSWKLNPDESEGTLTTYDLTGATINWTYHEVIDDCTVVDGSGSEPGLPNEEGSGGGEGGGPFHAPEQASLVVHWTDVPMMRPTPFYLGTGHVRLHDRIGWVDSCHSEQSMFDPDELDASLGDWLNTPSEPFPVIENGTMSGTWTDTISPYLSRTWTWKFLAGGK